jgi:hypothetical protein
MAANAAAMGLLLLWATLIVAYASEDDTLGDKDIVLFFLCAVGGMFMASSKALTLSFIIPSFRKFLLPFRQESQKRPELPHGKFQRRFLCVPHSRKPLNPTIQLLLSLLLG